MKGVIYCRVSSKEQVEGTSLESQEAACREYASRNSIAVLKVFIERGESAKFADRTQLLELLEFCRDRQNAVTVLLVWKVDRLARNVGDHFSITTSLKKQGIQVISATEPIDAKPEGKLLETILAGFAQFDNDLRAARTVQGMRRKIQEGIFPWKPPFGYRTINQRGSKKTMPDVPDQPVFGLLQRAWREFATGIYTKAELLREMTAWGVRTQDGRPILKQSLDKMLRDPFYAGIIRDPWSDKEYVGRHLPLVSREVFSQIQLVIEGRNRSLRHKKVRVEFPLRHFARCTACNGHLTGSLSRGRSRYYPYYHCFRQPCESPTYSNTEIVHAEFSEFLHSVAPKRAEIECFSDFLSDATRHRAQVSSVIRESRQLELKRLAEQNEELIKMKINQLITAEEFADHKRRIARRRYELEAHGLDNPFDEKHARDLLGEVCGPLMNLNATWLDIPPVLKQRFQVTVLPAGFAVEKIGTAQMSDLFSFFCGLRRPKSTLVAPTFPISHQLIRELEELASVFRLMHDPTLTA